VADNYYDFTRAVKFLKDVVRIPSDNPPGDCGRHAMKSTKLLEDLGFKVEQHKVPDALVRKYGMRSVTNLVIREKFGTGDGPTIALNAHGDVVPPGLGWSVDPYGAVEKNGAIYGRGAAVSKSDFATYAFALRALKARPEGLNGTVEIHLTYDEEAGGDIGPKWLLDQRITKPDLVICAGFSYSIVTAHNGCLHLEVSVHGKQAHAAMPETGHDALASANAILTALYAERKKIARKKSKTTGIGSPKLNVGLISGGINTNVVPDLVTFRLDRRLIPEENGRKVERDLKALIKKAGAGKGIKVDVKRILLAEPLKPLNGIERLVAPIQRHASQVLKQKIKATGVPLYTDARHYAAAKIPVVLYGAGPRSILEANAHRADENIRLKDLEAAIRVVAGALRDLLRR
jgi:succinyl-diaminopimelate desuccinylase